MFCCEWQAASVAVSSLSGSDVTELRLILLSVRSGIRVVGCRDVPGAHGVRGQGGSRMRRQAGVGRIGVLAVTPLLGMALAVVTAPPPAVAAGGPAGSAARLSSVPGGGCCSAWL